MANGNGRTYNMGGGRKFFGLSRPQKRANKNLGVNQGGTGGVENVHFRSALLSRVDHYFNGTQYAGKAEWDDNCSGEEYIKLKGRKPKIMFPFASIFSDRVGGKLVGHSTFPKFKIEDDEEAEYFINHVIIPSSFFKAKMLSVGKDLALRTSAFASFQFAEGKLQIKKYNSNYCYPTFDKTGDLESIEIKYIYETSEIDASTGQIIKRWYKKVLTKMSDTLYDNPVYKDNVEPTFVVAQSVPHNFGFVQGEWFRFGENNNGVDGENDPIISEMFDFIDALNYNLSLSDQACNYGAEPQLAISGMDSEDAETLIKSATKTWLMGREGKAEFLDAGGSGIENSKVQREDYIKLFQHIARIVLLDPEKMAANAQSGKAMEVMHAPMVELVNELRPWMEKGMTSLLQKITTSILILNKMGIETQFEVPRGWTPTSLEIKTLWPAIFELTIQDQQQVVSVGIQASNANLIARDTALKWIQAQGVDFGVEDFDAEVLKINSQQQFNTFGF